MFSLMFSHCKVGHSTMRCGEDDIWMHNHQFCLEYLPCSLYYNSYYHKLIGSYQENSLHQSLPEAVLSKDTDYTNIPSHIPLNR